MRIILLVVLEFVAVFGIPWAIYEVRTVLGIAPPPVIGVVHIANARRPAKVFHAKPVKAGDVERALLLQVSQLPTGRAVAKLPPPPPQARGIGRDTRPHETAAPAADDDYLPPWMRSASGSAKQALSEPVSVRVAVAAPRTSPARQARSKWRGDTYRQANRSRRSSRRESAYPWGF
jgi:hypothetical protein